MLYPLSYAGSPAKGSAQPRTSNRKVLDESCRVPGLPLLARSLRRMAPVELHERVDEIASHRSCAENLGELREVEQPVGVPGDPVRIVSVR